MARRKKNVGCLSALISLPLLPFAIILRYVKDYRPYNSKGAKISRAKKMKWF